MQQFGPAFGRMLSVVDRLEARPVEVALLVPATSDPYDLIKAAHAEFLPGGVIAGRIEQEGSPDPAHGVHPTDTEIPVLAGRGPIDGKPTAFVCEGYACGLPDHDPEMVRQRLAAMPNQA